MTTRGTDAYEDGAQLECMLHKAHAGNATFMAIRAAHFMGIDWRHVDTLRSMLEAREGRTLRVIDPREDDDDDLFLLGNTVGAIIRAACQSPIEQLFVVVLCQIEHKPFRGRMNMLLEREPSEDIYAWLNLNGEFTVCLKQQARIGRHRVDFALIGPERKVAIELDGHDFHERTKEQAKRDKSRDRDLVEAGWVVLRFTGSEIWKDPASCADQAFRIATARGATSGPSASSESYTERDH